MNINMSTKFKFFNRLCCFLLSASFVNSFAHSLNLNISSQKNSGSDFRTDCQKISFGLLSSISEDNTEEFSKSKQSFEISLLKKTTYSHYSHMLFMQESLNTSLFSPKAFESKVIHSSDFYFLEYLAKSLKQFRGSLEGSVFFFDCDDYIYRNIDKAISNSPPMNFFQFLKNNYSEENFQKIASGFFLNGEKSLTNQELPNLINFIKNSGGTAIMVTQCCVGKFGHIESMEAWRINSLRQLNIIFSEVPDQDFPECDVKESRFFQTSSTIPILRNGIIFAVSADKGQLISRFLKKSTEKFDFVFFGDDTASQIDKVKAQIPKVICHNLLKSAIQPCTSSIEFSSLQALFIKNDSTWINDKASDKYTEILTMLLHFLHVVTPV